MHTKIIYRGIFSVFMRPAMSAKPVKTKRKIGRPATGITKSKPSITMDKKIEKMARKAATLEGISFSAWVERACRSNLQSVVEKAGMA